MIAADSSVDVAALVRARLLTHAVGLEIPFDRVHFRYSQESVLRRLARASLGQRIAHAGGTALAAHLGVEPRQLARIEIQLADIETLEQLPAALCESSDLASDGLLVDREALRSRGLDRGSAAAWRVTTLARLGTAVAPIRVDGEVNDLPSSTETRELRSVLPDAEPFSVQEQPR